VISISGVEGDYDGGEMPAADASARLDRVNLAHLIDRFLAIVGEQLERYGGHQTTRPKWKA
jgi:hypothetical protein